MAELSREELQEIIDRDMPGHVIVERLPAPDAARRRAPAEAATPDLAALKRKYIGDPAGDAGAGSPRRNPEDYPSAGDVEENREDDAPRAEADDEEIVTVRPKATTDAWGGGPGPKAVIISRSQKKIKGAQG
jgi:hypothetical protein